jgi:hypothetical protein
MEKVILPTFKGRSEGKCLNAAETLSNYHISRWMGFVGKRWHAREKL